MSGQFSAQLVLRADVRERARVVVVEEVNLRLVDVIVGDSRHESPAPHAFDATRLVEGLVVHRERSVRQPLKIQLHLEEERPRVEGILVLAVPDDREVLALLPGRGLEIELRIPDDAVLGAVGEVEQVARLVPRLDPLQEPRCHARPVVAPVMDEHRVHVEDSRLQRDVVEPLVHRHGELPVLVAERRVVEDAAEEHAVRRVREGRFRAVAVAQGQIHELQDRVREQVPGSGEERRGEDLHQERDGDLRLRIRDRGRVDQVRDAASGEVLPDVRHLARHQLGPGVLDQIHAQERQPREGRADRFAHLADRGVLARAHRQDFRFLERSAGVRQHRLGAGLGLVVIAGQIRALLEFPVQPPRQPVLALPGVGGQQRPADLEQAERGLVRGRPLGLLPRLEIQSREIAPLGRGVDQRAPGVQMADDVHQPLVDLLLRGVPLHQAPDREVDGLLAVRIDQRVGGLLHAVVLELVGRIERLGGLRRCGTAEADQRVVLAQRNHHVAH